MNMNQKCIVCNSEDFKFKLVIDKTTLKTKKDKCSLVCAHCGTPSTVVGGKLIQ